jgi:hypothetical protein
MDALRILLNVLWLVLVGWASALTFALAALIMFVLVVTIPFAVASWRIAAYTLWPFSRSACWRWRRWASRSFPPRGSAWSAPEPRRPGPVSVSASGRLGGVVDHRR